MQLRMTGFGKIIAATALAGVLLGLGVWFEMPSQYISQSTMRVVFHQPVSAEAFTAYMNHATQTALRRSTRAAIIEGYRLYPGRRAKMPPEDVVAEMKDNIEVRPSGAIDRSTAQTASVFEIQFRYPDGVMARRVGGELVGLFFKDAAPAV